MSRVIFTKTVGGDGAAITVGTDDNGNLFVGATYPLSKITGTVDQALDDVTARIEAALGNAGWAKAIFDPLDAAAKAEIDALING